MSSALRAPFTAISPCIRCGDCLPACPADLSPLRLYALWQDGALERMESEESLESCVLCRRCDMVCPSSLPLSASFAEARERTRDMRRQQETAARLRARYENHMRRQSAPRHHAEINPAELAASAQRRAAQKIAPR